MRIYVIIVMGILSQLGYNGSRVAVALYALELGADQFTVGVLIALYAIFPMMLAIAVGQLIDRVGPFLPIVAGIIAVTVALVLPPIFPGIPVLYVSCTILGLAHLFFMIPIEAGVGGIGGSEKRAANYAVLSMGWSVANFFGPIIAGFSIDHIGHVQVFWVLASCSALPLLIMFARPGLVPGAARHGAKDSRRSVRELWGMPNLRAIFVTAALIHSAQNLFQFYFPIYGHSLGISASLIGTILGLVAGAAFVIRIVIPFMMKKWKESQVLIVSVFIAALAFALLPFFANPYSLAAIAFLLGLGVGCANPLSMSLLYLQTPAGRIAESVGVLRAAYNITNLLVPIVFGSVGSAFGFSTVFLSNTAMLVAGGFLMRKVHRPVADLPTKTSDAKV